MPENSGRLLSIRVGTDVFLLHFIKKTLIVSEIIDSFASTYVSVTIILLHSMHEANK